MSSIKPSPVVVAPIYNQTTAVREMILRNLDGKVRVDSHKNFSPERRTVVDTYA